ncbi:hypothetical protein ACGC1H_003957 [Rhizoctonia solani]
MISITHSNPSSTISSSSKDSWEDQSTQSLSHNEDPQHTSSPMRSLSSSLGESSALNSPIQSDSTERSIEDDPHLPKVHATKRDKLIGEAERVLSKVIRDPELHERAILRAADGKDAADGLVVDPNLL